MIGKGMLVNDEGNRQIAWLWSTMDLMQQITNQFEFDPAQSVFLRLDNRPLKIYSRENDPAASITFEKCEPTLSAPPHLLYSGYKKCLQLRHSGVGPNLLLSSGPHESNG
jgi:hypothetical protein